VYAAKNGNSSGIQQFEPAAMNVDDLNRRIHSQVFSELRDVHVHASAVEVIVIAPNRLQSK
jgi:hypothetical protein